MDRQQIELVGSYSCTLTSIGKALHYVVPCTRFCSALYSYYGFVYSCVNYGIATWGTADQNKTHEIEVKMNNIVRTITWNKKFSHVSYLYQNLNLLKLNDIYKLELAKFMYKFYNNNLPIVFQNRFTKNEKIHTYVTKEAN